MDASFTNNVAQRLSRGTGNFYGTLSNHLPSAPPFESAAAHNHAEAQAARISGNKRFGKKNKSRFLRRRLANQPAGLFHRRLTIEKNGRRLYDRDFDGRELLVHFLVPNETVWRCVNSSQTYLNLSDEEKSGKDSISRKERKGCQGDRPRAVIPSECEGSKKDFSLRSK